jgi:chorismate mutase
MANIPKYYIIEASALPDVFLKVAEAKRLLETGEVTTVNEATRRTGISRSAFYKYRDTILPFQNMMTGRIITFQMLLHDEVGLLSKILDIFTEAKANIITINSISEEKATITFKKY